MHPYDPYAYDMVHPSEPQPYDYVFRKHAADFAGFEDPPKGSGDAPGAGLSVEVAKTFWEVTFFRENSLPGLMPHRSSVC